MAADNAAHLLSIIASYLRKRGLVKTLAIFLSESEVKISDEVGDVDLETLYNFYMPMQASVISKKRKKKLEIADDLFEKRLHLNEGNDQGFESLGASVVTIKAGDNCLAGQGHILSKISSDILTRNETMKDGERLEKHMEVQVQQDGFDGTVEQKKKQKKETDNAGHFSTPVLKECESGRSEVETEMTSYGKQKQSKKKKPKIDASAINEKWHEDAKTTEEKQNREKTGRKTEPNGTSSEVNVAIDSFDAKKKKDLSRSQKSETNLNENDECEANTSENNFEKESIRKAKKVNKKCKKSGADVNQQVGQLHADFITQQEPCANHDNSIVFVEAGKIQQTGDLKCEATPNKTKKSGKTRRKHGGEELPVCDIALQESGSKKCNEFESSEVLKRKKLVEEDGMVTKKQKVSRKTEHGVSTPSSKATVVKSTNETKEDLEDQSMMGGTMRIQTHSRSKSVSPTDSSFQPIESTLQHEIIESRTQKMVERDGASAKIKKHRKEVSVKADDRNVKPESMEVCTEIIQKKYEDEASTKQAGISDMVDFKDNHVLSAKKDKKIKESGKKKKPTDENKTIEVGEISTVVNGNSVTSLRETLHSIEGIDKRKDEVVGTFLGKPEPADVKTKQQKDTTHSDTPTGTLAFKRVNINQVQYSDSRLKDNSYWAKGGADQGYGAKAQEQLQLVRGRDFRHEKTKKKRGSYRGGLIDLQSHSIKFDHSDED